MNMDLKDDTETTATEVMVLSFKGFFSISQQFVHFSQKLREGC